MRTHHHHSRRLVPVALAVGLAASLLFAACEDETEDGAVPDVEQIGTGAGGGAASGIEPANACGLLDPATVDGLLGTSGVAMPVGGVACRSTGRVRSSGAGLRVTPRA